jgi:hypothetical protein
MTVEADAIRKVNEAEIERFREDGWAFLPGLFAPALANELLLRAQGLMGVDGDANVLRSGYDFETAGSSQPYRRASDSDPLFSDVTRSPRLAGNAALLLGRDAAQRYFDDSLLVKLPVSRRPDRAGALGWHADTNPTDRMWLSFWIALDRVGPDQGGVRYLTGSHRLGPLWRGGACIPLDQAYDLAPRLRSCRMSDPVDAVGGDVIAHCSSVVHATDVNTGDAPRWVHRITYFPADAVYMGVPSPAITSRGCRAFETLDHPDFPIVYRPESDRGEQPVDLAVRRFHHD